MEGAFNIVDLFYDAALKKPLKTAIIYRGEEISFADLEKQVTVTAHYFLNQGINKGDRVMIFVPMSINLYRIVLALFRIGAVAVFLDEWVSKKRMEECCKIAKCKVLIGNFKVKLISCFSAELRKIPIKLAPNYVYTNIKNTFPVTRSDDTALITFTTGSTGPPKAAKRTHAFLFEQFSALKQKLKPHADEVDMPVLPIVLLINLGAGVTSVIANFKANKPNTLQPEKIVEQLKRYKVNRIIGSPFFVKQLAKFVDGQQLTLPQLHKIFTGGAPVFLAEALIYDRAFPKAEIEVVYGSTEAEPISAICVKELIKEKTFSKGLNVGKVAEVATVKIISITDQPVIISHPAELDRMEMPIGEIGEIIVSGKHVLREYVNNPDAILRNKIFIGELCWHRTGDSGYFDINKKLYLTGRCNSLLYIGEKRISPFIYENYFQTVNGIEMGTVIKHKEELVAIVELTADAKKENVQRAIHNLNFPFDTITYLKKIPRDPRHNSKIDYQKLTTLLMQTKG